MKQSDGNMFEGKFVDGEKKGRGLMKFVDNSWFDGTFSANQMNGRGKMYYSDNSELEGNWKYSEFVSGSYLSCNGRNKVNITVKQKAPTVDRSSYLDAIQP